MRKFWIQIFMHFLHISKAFSSKPSQKTLVVIGGGAAGYFGAIKAASVAGPHLSVLLFEAGPKSLRKVKISGGGRCNVMHDVRKPVREIVDGYPRGHRQLLGPMTSKFGPKETFDWFKKRGVELKIEEDGRMFPVTDSSQSVIDCLTATAKEFGVSVNEGTKVLGISKNPINNFVLEVETRKSDSKFSVDANYILLATGSSREGYKWAKKLGHKIIPPLPSLFTLTIPCKLLADLAGITLKDVELTLMQGMNNTETHLIPNSNKKSKRVNISQRGSILITHSGLSGPAALKLSAFGAREMGDAGYRSMLRLNWVPSVASNGIELESILKKIRQDLSKKEVSTFCPLPSADLPKRLWRNIISASDIGEKERWGACSNEKIKKLANILTSSTVEMTGKGTFKEEFVTCGGVMLDDINMKTMESKIVPNLHFAGEVIDVDGITGGYNFQNAWTTGWCAGDAIAKKCNEQPLI